MPESTRSLKSVLAKSPADQVERVAADLARFLRDVHRAVPLSAASHTRALIGGDNGLLACLQRLPPDLFQPDLRRDLLHAAGGWSLLLDNAQLVRIAGARRIETGNWLAPEEDPEPWEHGLAEEDVADVVVCLLPGMYTSTDEASNRIFLEVFIDTYGLDSKLFPFAFGLALLRGLARARPQAAAAARLLRMAFRSLLARPSHKMESSFLREIWRYEEHVLQPPLRFQPRPSLLPPECPRVTFSPHLLPSEDEIFLLTGSSELGRTIEVAGRVTTLRRHSRLLFFDLEHEGRKLQGALSRSPGQAEDVTERIRKGDLIGVRGRLAKSRTGQPTLFVEALTFNVPFQLDPAHRTLCLPSAAELLTLDEVLGLARDFFRRRGFLEQASPVILSSYFGGTSRPFPLWMEGDAMYGYLRATFEIHLKATLGAGVPRCFQIGPCFRNEARDSLHSPEFLLLEAYAALTPLEDMRRIVQSFVSTVLYGPQEADAAAPVYSYREALLRVLGLDVERKEDLAALEEKLRTPEQMGPLSGPRIVVKALKKLVAPRLGGVWACTHIPTGASPLTAESSDRSTRVWVFAEGISVADIAWESTNLEETRARLGRQLLIDRPDAVRDYRKLIEILAGGLPPSSGTGISLSRLLKLRLGRQNLNDVTVQI